MATKKASSRKQTRAKARTGRRVLWELKQVCPFRPDPTKYAKYQLVQDGREVGFVYVRGGATTDCTETWQLYKTTADGVGTGENGFQRGYYVYPSYEARQTESPDVSTRYIYRAVVTSVTSPPGLTNGTHYQTITAVCRG